MSGTLRWGACSEIGLVRQLNEDAKFHQPPLFAVADGMGGHSAGDIASRMAIEELSRELGHLDSLSDAIHAANRAIFERASASPALSGMGTTITALVTDGSTAQIAHVGDSRAYLVRSGTLTRLTTDHTVVSRLVQQGRIDPGDADRHPQRSYLERALGVDSEVEVDVHVLDFAPADRVLLCSDGLFGMIDDDLILSVLEEERDPQRAAERLCEEAVHAGGADNVTCIVVDFPAVAGGEHNGGSLPARHPAFAAARTDTGPLTDDRKPGITVASRPSTEVIQEPVFVHHQPPVDRPPRRLKFLTATAISLVVLMGLGLLARSAIRNSWYVGSRDGQVAIFNGIPGEIGGLSFARVVKTTELAVDSLPAGRSDDLVEGIDARSRKDAEQVVANLQASALPGPSPSPTPSPSASPGPASSPEPSPESPAASPALV